MARRTARDRAPLNRDRVLRAAVELADEQGVAALTMERIGSRLGVEAMSLYRHVRNKDDILDGMVDVVFTEIELPADRSNWRTVLRARAISARAAMRRHPWAIMLMESRMAPGPANLRNHDETLAVLLDARHLGGRRDARLQPGRLLRLRVRAPGGPAPVRQRRRARGRRARSSSPRWRPRQYPSFVRVALELLESGFDYGAEFEFGLDLILDGLERTLQSA